MEKMHQTSPAELAPPKVLELKLSEIEACRRQLHEIVDRNIDQLIQRITHSEADNGQFSLPLNVPPAIFKGKKPVAIVFPDGTKVVTSTWKKTVAAIMRDCNAEPARHETLMRLCGLINGNFRAILSSTPEKMDVPLQIDEGLFLESKFDTEALLNVLTKKILDVVGYDYRDITVEYRDPRQQMDDQTAAEHPEEGPSGQGIRMQM